MEEQKPNKLNDLLNQAKNYSESLIVDTKVEKGLFDYPTEIVTLPSKGFVYPESNILSSGELEINYPDTTHEDILSSQKLIKQGKAIDKFLRSIIASDINYDDLLLGDKSAIMIASRILMYGAEYKVKDITCQSCDEKVEASFNLTEIEDKEINYELLNRNNLYEFELPVSKDIITFKLLTHKDDSDISRELKYREDVNTKLNKKDDVDRNYSIRLKHMILKVSHKKGDTYINYENQNELRNYKMLAKDSFEFRKYLKMIEPDINNKVSFVCPKCGEINIVTLPMTVEFFWPNT
jgi:hypothetical protein